MIDRRLKLVGVMGLAVSACNDFESVLCPASVEPAVVVEVRNARTGGFEAKEALGIVRDGVFVDTLEPRLFYVVNGQHVPAALGGADERPGTYIVSIEKTGFRSWLQTGVRVRSNECGVLTENLVAELEPLP
jgi:hypothetical protein